MLKETEYVYAVAYTHTLENKMLSKADYEALLNASSFEDALRILLDKGYGNNKDCFDLETLLKEEFAYTWNEVKNACPEDAPIDILLVQNDFHNLKTILKSVFSGAAYKPLMLEPYTVSPEVIHRVIAEGKSESLPDIFKKSASQAYRLLAREEDGQLAEIVLDKALFEHIRETAKQAENDFLIGWVDLNISLMNMKIALRGAHNGKSRAFLRDSMLESSRLGAEALADAAAGDVSAVLHVFTQSGFEEAAKAARISAGAFEKWCDNELIRYVGSARYKVFGFEPILSFLIHKQFELQTVRIILSGLRSGIPAEVLRERLRDVYV